MATSRNPDPRYSQDTHHLLLQVTAGRIKESNLIKKIKIQAPSRGLQKHSVFSKFAILAVKRGQVKAQDAVLWLCCGPQ
eukprot:scaffold9195_cov69-Cyclotella_meneghiniana.AAC.11